MKVRIYKPSKSSMQSGLGKTQDWLLECDCPGERRPEPLMGWTSAEDTLNQVRMYFSSRQGAIDFAKSKGWTYSVAKESVRKVRPRNYADNFKYIPPKGQDA